MTAPMVGLLTPADVSVGEIVYVTGYGNNRRAETRSAEIVKVGRKLVTARLDAKWAVDLVLRLDTQVENDEFPGWTFRTHEQQLDDERRTAARVRLAAHGVDFVSRHGQRTRDDLVDVDLAETLADAADAWAAGR